MTLATLCDLVWVEIWDDCSPMADRATYREIMVRVFIKGENPSSITYKAADGKMKRLVDPGDSKPTGAKLASAKALYDQLRAAKSAAAHAQGVTSPGDG